MLTHCQTVNKLFPLSVKNFTDFSLELEYGIGMKIIKHTENKWREI